MTSEEKHLDLINAFAGLCFDLPKWPNTLYKLGFKIKAIEWQFTNTNGGFVKPELIIVSQKLNHAILLECKSGTLDDDQLKRYSDVALDDIVVKANFTVAGFDVTFFVYEVSLEEARRKIAGSFKFPLIVLTGDKIERIADINKFSHGDVDQDFRNPIDVDLRYRPYNLIPFSNDKKSFPDSKVVNAIVVGLTSMLITETVGTVIGVLNFVQKYIVKNNLFDCFLVADQKKIIERCQGLMRSIVKKYYKNYLTIMIKDGAEINPNKYDIIKTCHSENEGADSLKEKKQLIRIAGNVIQDMGDKASVAYQTSLDEFLLSSE